MGGFLLYTQEGRTNLKGLSGINDTGADFFGYRKYLNTIDLIPIFYTEYGILNEGYGTILTYTKDFRELHPCWQVGMILGKCISTGCQKGPFILSGAQMPSTVRVHQFVSPVKTRI